MRRQGLVVALAALAVAHLLPGLGVPAEDAWRLLAPLAGVSLLAALRETRGAHALPGVLLVMAVPACSLPGLVCWLPGGRGPWAGSAAGVAATALWLLLGLLLADSLRWHVATRWRVWPGAWLEGGVLATLALHPPTGGLPLAASPVACLVEALFLGWALGRVTARVAASGPSSRQSCLAGGLLVTLCFLLLRLLVLPLGALPLRIPGLSPVVAPLVLHGAAAGLVAWMLAHRLPRWMPRRGGRVLLVNSPAPVRMLPGGHDPLDDHASRLPRGQGAWGSEVEPSFLAGHRIARNLEAPAVVLEHPTLGELAEELRECAYEVVGVGFEDAEPEAIREVCRVVRAELPGARLVLGGQGVACLDAACEDGPLFEGLVDEVCQADGVPFMRRLLGEDPEARLDHALPLQVLHPPGLRPAARRMASLVAGFGCGERCERCATSASFAGHHRRQGSPRELARQVRRYLEADPGLAAITVHDEDLLADRERARELARALASEPGLDVSRVRLAVSASLASLARYSTVELAELGAAYVWIGVESRDTRLRERYHPDPEGCLEELADQGIGVLPSSRRDLEPLTTVYRQRGPLVLYLAEVWLRGYLALAERAEPALQRRALDLRERLQEVASVVRALSLAGDEEGHRRRARRWLRDAPRAGVRRGPIEALGSWYVAFHVRLTAWLAARFGPPARQPVVRRMVYPRRAPGV